MTCPKILSLIALCSFLVIGCDSGGETTPADPNAPVLDSIGSQSLLPGETVSITLSATNGNNMQYFADGSVAGGNPFLENPPATFSMSSGIFSWTPGQNQSGNSYTILFTATNDAQLSDSETVTITVMNQISLGEQLYAQHCEECHGPQGQNGSASLVVGIELITLNEAIARNDGGMANREGINSLTQAEREAIIAYLGSVPGN